MKSVSLSRGSVHLRERPPIRLAQLQPKLAAHGIKLPPELTSGFEREFRASMRITKSPQQSGAEVMERFAAHFGSKAEDKRAFHSLMKKVYGSGYDAKQAEAFRQKALAGDFSWMPPVRYLDNNTLGGAYGAYDQQAGVVYLNKNLLADPDLALEVYAEEFGHFLDTKLNQTDTAGDEGELFRRLLGGEQLSAKQIREIRSENDHGVIVVDGREVAVEFWNPFKAVAKVAKKATKAVGKVVKKATKAVKNAGKAVGKAAKSMGKAVAHVGKGIVKGTESFFGGLGEGVGGFFNNLFKGRVGDAFGALTRGFEKAFLDAPGQVLAGLLDGAHALVRAPTFLLGPLGRPLRKMLDRVGGVGKNLVMGVYGAATGVVRNVNESVSIFMRGVGKLFRGDFGGFGDMAKASWKAFVQTPADALLLVGGRLISSIQTLIGLEPPGRKLRPDEIAILRQVYGDSIDYDAIVIKEGDAGLFSTNDRPFAHGNTIYMKGRTITPEILVHEVGHVWQYQNGGSDYMTEALWSQQFGHGYAWEDSVPQTPWEDLEPEQQSELLGTAYVYGTFNPRSPNYGKFHFDVDGDGWPEDLTAYIQRVMREVRAGRGAP